LFKLSITFGARLFDCVWAQKKATHWIALAWLAMRAVDLACTPRSEGIPVPGLARLHEDIPAWNCLRREQLRVGAESWDVVREQHKALVQLASRVRVTHTFGVCKTGDEKVGVKIVVTPGSGGRVVQLRWLWDEDDPPAGRDGCVPSRLDVAERCRDGVDGVGPG
jgi:hypothetical protein